VKEKKRDQKNNNQIVNGGVLEKNWISKISIFL